MQNTGDITRAKSLSFDTHPNVRIYEGDMVKSKLYPRRREDVNYVIFI